MVAVNSRKLQFAYSVDAVNAYLFVKGNVIQVSEPVDILSFAWGVGSVVTAPEPSSLFLIPMGVGAMLLMREENPTRILTRPKGTMNAFGQIVPHH